MLYLLLLGFAGQPALAAEKCAPSTLEHNKRIVREFYEQAFNRHQPKDAAMKYLAMGYRQHNPHVADGRQGFIDAFSQATGADKSVTEFKRFLAEGDLVMVHSHGIKDTADPKDPGVAVVDIFRVEGDLITEHWDVGQKVPVESKNKNGRF